MYPLPISISEIKQSVYREEVSNALQLIPVVDIVCLIAAEEIWKHLDT